MFLIDPRIVIFISIFELGVEENDVGLGLLVVYVRRKPRLSFLVEKKSIGKDTEGEKIHVLGGESCSGAW